ncbi:MAG: phosphatase PAP2 family protein, partial [Thermoprotei archaeon]
MSNSLLTAALFLIFCFYVYAIVSDSTNAWILITEIGGEYAYVILFLILYVFVDADLAVNALLITLASISVNGFFKGFFKVPRPSGGRVVEEGYSFPSRHASTSSAFWGYIVSKYRSIFLVLLSTLIVVAVAHSRIALGVHVLADVCGGIALGVGLGITYSVLQERRQALTYYATLILGILTSIIVGTLYYDSIMWKILGLMLSITPYKLIASQAKNLNTSRPLVGAA